MQNCQEIAAGLFYLGGNDRRIALFESAYPVPRGVSYNSYLLKDEKNVLLDTVDKADIFGALLAYRIIYYVLPLVGVGGLFFIYENWLRSRMKRWLADAKEKIPHIPEKIKNIHRRKK